METVPRVPLLSLIRCKNNGINSQRDVDGENSDFPKKFTCDGFTDWLQLWVKVFQRNTHWGLRGIMQSNKGQMRYWHGKVHALLTCSSPVGLRLMHLPWEQAGHSHLHHRWLASVETTKDLFSNASHQGFISGVRLNWTTFKAKLWTYCDPM